MVHKKIWTWAVQSTTVWNSAMIQVDWIKCLLDACFGSSLTWRCFLTKAQQTSADMRLFTDLDQQGLFSHFCSTWDGSEWQVHEIKSLATERLHLISKRGDAACLSAVLSLSMRKLTGFSWPHVSIQPVRDYQTLPAPLLRLIRCNLKSKIPDSTFSDGIACMFCMAVWIKDWLSLLLSCSNLCPLSLQAGSAEFPKQSGLSFLGRYRLRHFNELKCKAK